MRIIIIGAGSVGRQLSQVLCQENDVVVIDQNETVLNHLKNEQDIMAVPGNGATAKVLLKAGIGKADILLAVTNNSEANILACNLASKYHVNRKIARIRNLEYFDQAHGLTAETFGIDQAIIPEYECAQNILDSLMRSGVKETVKFSHPDAQMVNFQIRPGSIMIGKKLSGLELPENLRKLRICAILRYGQMIIPRGNTSFMAFDEIYVAGEQTLIDEMIEWADPDHHMVSKVILAGATPLSLTLASLLRVLDMRLTIIEEDKTRAEHAADTLGANVMVLNGLSTDRSVLTEAGVENCDAFITAHRDNETNILSCLLAKRMGARTVIAVTKKIDYMRIVAGMNNIDCGFSPMIAAVNILIREIETDCRRTVALLQRTAAEVLEMKVMPKSIVANKTIMDIDKDKRSPRDMVFALIQRGKELIPAVGDEVLKVNDKVVVLTHHASVPKIEKLFLSKGLQG